VFTHGGPIAQALALAAQSRRLAFNHPRHASISQLEVCGDHWQVRGFNEVSHLTDDYSTLSAGG
jgi:probable phosphoglycerate mutase